MDIRRRHPDANPRGGVNIAGENDSALIKKVIKTVGKKILTGGITDFMKFSRPAALSGGYTTLQTLTFDFQYTEFLKRAAATADPYERLKLCTLFVIAGLHKSITTVKSKAPLNPIIGETCKAVKDDGTAIYLEQTVHHPPISNWEMFGPGYYYSGHAHIKSGLLGPNSMWMNQKGPRQIVFDDGSIVTYNLSPLRVKNLVVGNRVGGFYKNFTVEYETHGLIAEIKINPQPKKLLGFIGKKSKLPNDHLTIDFLRIEGNSKVQIGTGKGSWLEYIEIDGEEMWDISDPTLEWRFDSELPSDSMHRQDLAKIRDGDIDGAQTAKDQLENWQRADKHLREQARKSSK